MATPPIFVDVDGDANNMNVSLWGELQYFIDLSMIYVKLPLAPFFCLRQVCKEWNCLASNRQFLEQNFKPPFSSNPYFILRCPNGGMALLTLEGSSWSSTPVPRMQFQVSGLLFDDLDNKCVFDLHTRVFYTLPPHGEEKHEFDNSLVGMMVNTSLVPYGFRVIVADCFGKTRVYDSNSNAWTIKLSTCPDTPYYSPSLSKWAVNNSIYFKFWNGQSYKFITYDLEKDKWNLLDLGFSPLVWQDIGMWKDRWFALVSDPLMGWVVWECIPNSGNRWNKYDCMPKDIRQWGSCTYMTNTKFYGEHVLIYNFMSRGKRAVLYNLDQKTWKKTELPATLMW